MRQEVVLAMLAKEPSHGYELRGRLNMALGPLGDAMNAGQIYVTLGRLEKAGFVTCERSTGLPRTAPGPQGLRAHARRAGAGGRWLTEVSWPKPDLAEFHLKLVAAAAAGLADPIGIVDAQRRELLRRCATPSVPPWRSRRAPMPGSCSKGIVLRLQADLRWLEACEAAWTDGGTRPMNDRGQP